MLCFCIFLPTHRPLSWLLNSFSFGVWGVFTPVRVELKQHGQGDTERRGYRGTGPAAWGSRQLVAGSKHQVWSLKSPRPTVRREVGHGQDRGHTGTSVCLWPPPPSVPWVSCKPLAALHALGPTEGGKPTGAGAATGLGPTACHKSSHQIRDTASCHSTSATSLTFSKVLRLSCGPH